MLHSGVLWVLDLRVHLSLIIFPTITLLHYSISFISFSLFYLLLVFLHSLSTLSGDPPKFITWRIVTSFPLSIPQTLIQRSLVWEGHLVRESFCYIGTWQCVYPLWISSLGFICLCSGFVHLYICFKKKFWKKKSEKKWMKWEENKNKHMCVCA